MRLWTFSLRESRHRRGRTLLTLAGIALGVAAVVSTRLTVHTVRAAYADLYGAPGHARLEVSVPGGGGLDGSLAETLTAVPGVRAVVPRVLGVVALLGPKGQVPVPLQGLPTERLEACEDWTLCRGCWPRHDGAALLSEELAGQLGLLPGDRLRVWAPSGVVELSLTGLLRPRGAECRAGR
jgi:hypothetical protein